MGILLLWNIIAFFPFIHVLLLPLMSQKVGMDPVVESIGVVAHLSVEEDHLGEELADSSAS